MAYTLATWAFGSVDAFNSYANAQAKTLGLTSVSINDPSGLDVGTVGSAKDMVLLGINALANPTIAGIVQQESAVIPVAGTIHNYNVMLGKEGNIGVKTGNNAEDQGAFLFAAKRIIKNTDTTVVGAIIDAPNLVNALNDSLPVVTSGDAGYDNIFAVGNNQIIGTFSVPWQGKVKAVSAAGASFYTWKQTSLSAQASEQKVTNNATKGYKTGTVNAINTLNKDTKQVDVVLDESITKPGLWWRIEHVF
jgi:D-alanyl-D-alanine carboxypeptidase (penicillin-binding protein 5/6)